MAWTASCSAAVGRSGSAAAQRPGSLKTATAGRFGFRPLAQHVAQHLARQLPSSRPCFLAGRVHAYRGGPARSQSDPWPVRCRLAGAMAVQAVAGHDQQALQVMVKQVGRHRGARNPESSHASDDPGKGWQSMGATMINVRKRSFRQRRMRFLPWRFPERRSRERHWHQCCQRNRRG